MRCLKCGLDDLPVGTEWCPGCHNLLMVQLRDTLPPGTLLRSGGYRVEHALGQGGFGITYRALHVALDHPVAVKEYFPREYAERVEGSLAVRPLNPADGRFDRWLGRFTREGRTLARLCARPGTDTSGIARAIDLFEERGTAYLVMDLVDGHDLRRELTEGNALPEPRIREVMGQLVGALEIVHAAKVAHLDLKPENVVITPTGHAVLIDFGAAVIPSPGRKRSTAVFTEAYVAPEVPFDRRVGPASDVYELGVMLFEMATGHLPPSAFERLDALANDAPDPLDLSAVPRPWRELCRLALIWRVEDRPHDVGAWWRGEAEVVARAARPTDAPSEADLAREEAAVERYATAFLRPSLMERIATLKGQSLASWRVVALNAIGGRGLLARVEKGPQRGLLKLPHLPYDRPTQFGGAEIRARRDELRHEAAMLRAFDGGLFPRLLDEAEGPNPLLAGRSAALVNGEVYVVMEFLAGEPLDRALQPALATGPTATNRRDLARWTRQLLEFLAVLKHRAPGHFYTDLKPANLRITPAGDVRLLDAGAVAVAGSERHVQFTPGYVDLARVPGRPTAANLEALSLQALGRTLYAAMANRVLYEGASLDLGAVEANWGADWRVWLSACESVAFDTFDAALRSFSVR